MLLHGPAFHETSGTIFSLSFFSVFFVVCFLLGGGGGRGGGGGLLTLRFDRATQPFSEMQQATLDYLKINSSFVFK